MRRSEFVPEIVGGDDDDDNSTYFAEQTRRYAWLDPELWVEDPGAFRVKTVGRFHVDAVPLMFIAAIVMTPIDNPHGVYVDRWCYETIGGALEAAKAWSGIWLLTEPEGWYRHPVTGRRRPNGDPSQEHIWP